MRSLKCRCIKINMSYVLTFIFIFTMQCHFWLAASEFAKFREIELFRSACFYIAIGCLAMKLVIESMITIRQLGIMAIILAIAFLGVRISGGLTVIKLILFGMAIKGTPERYVIRYMATSNLVLAVITMMSSLLGLIANNKLIELSGKQVYCIGFLNPNTTALIICTVLFSLVYLKRDKNDGLFGIVIFIFLLIINKYMGSRSAIISLSVLLILMIIKKYFSLFEKFIFSIYGKIILLTIFPGLTLLSYVLGRLYTTNGLVKELNILFSWRFFLWNKYIDRLPISLLGNNVNYEYLGTLDNGYLVLLYNYGIIIWSMYMIMFSKVIWQACKEKDYIVIMLVLAYEAYIFVEGYPVFINANIILIIFFCKFWNKINLLAREDD